VGLLESTGYLSILIGEFLNTLLGGFEMHRRTSFLSVSWIIIAWAWLASHAWAQQPIPAVTGSTLAGQTFALNQQRGKVTVLFFWTTDCAICRDKMPELREQARQWAAQPFAPVLINMDARMQDIDAYNAIINRAVPAKDRLPQLWALAPDYADNLGTVDTIKDKVPTELPLVYVIDKTGKVVARHQGRFTPQVWQDVAKLF
jgi:thiol-disulfide isomerase/thioredoxin